MTRTIGKVCLNLHINYIAFVREAAPYIKMGSIFKATNAISK